jgi:protein-S-isoprenylcysteine O-methyltransferase Ste14
MRDDKVEARKFPSQTLRKLVLAVSAILGLSVIFVTDSYWPDGGAIHETIEWVGIVLISICVLGRTWCTLYIGGRKYHQLIDDGPYSVVRHPLYVFSVIGAFGVGAQAGGFTVALACGFLTWLILLKMAHVEEERMVENYGAKYLEYMAQVPRFIPKFSRYHSRTSLEVYPRQIATTFFDAVIFFVAVPVMELVDYLHSVGVLPTLIWLP